MRRSLCLAALCVLLFSPLVQASSSVDYNLLIHGQPVINEYTVGTGANTSYLVIDFANSGGAGPLNSYLFEYKWDNVITTGQMIAAISNFVTDPLNVDSDTFDFGFGPVTFINDFAYLTETSDGRANTFWLYSTGVLGADLQNPLQQTVTWTGSFSGVDDINISANSFTGFTYLDYDPQTFEGINPQDPRVPTLSALPEPSAVLLLAGAPLWLLNRRKTRRARSL